MLKIIFKIVKNYLKPTVALAPKALISLLTISLFFNPFITISHNYAYFLGEKKDFLITFAYLSDFLLFSLCMSIILFIYSIHKLHKIDHNHTKSVISADYILLCLALISYFFGLDKLVIPEIALYYIVLFFKWVVLRGTLRLYTKSLFNYFATTFITLGILESILAMFQFAKQSNIGFRIFGEPKFSPYLWGIAKVEALGQVFIRPYGTFVHPNILAAFLVVAFILAFYKYIYLNNNNWLIHKLLFVLPFIIGTCVLLTFSRASWLALGLTVPLSILAIYKKLNYEQKNKIKLILASLVAYAFILLIIFLPFVKQRGNVFDKAYKERKSFNQAGIEMLYERPIIGQGPGQSLLHMEQKLEPGTQPIEIQPVHNYYLLLAVEIGVPAFLVFIYIIGNDLKRGVKRVINDSHGTQSRHLVPLITAVCACLVLMLFDHYFYTIESSSLLFWLLLGLTALESGLAQEQNSLEHNFRD